MQPKRMTYNEMIAALAESELRIRMLERIILDMEYNSGRYTGSICHNAACDYPGNPEHPHYVRSRVINYDVPQIYLA